MSASLELIIGPMFSGKSTDLVRRLRRHCHAQMRVLAITHSRDTRYSSEGAICTHEGAQYKGVSTDSLYTYLESIKWALEFNVVGIDEAQFFDARDLHDAVDRLLTEKNVRVIVAGLDATYERAPFRAVTDLMSMATRVDKLLAVCQRCRRADAAFTAYKGAVRFDGFLVGGASDFEACCGACWTAPPPSQ
jgi:thymidine kinase